MVEAPNLEPVEVEPEQEVTLEAPSALEEPIPVVETPVEETYNNVPEDAIPLTDSKKSKIPAPVKNVLTSHPAKMIYKVIGVTGAVIVGAGIIGGLTITAGVAAATTAAEVMLGGVAVYGAYKVWKQVKGAFFGKFNAENKPVECEDSKEIKTTEENVDHIRKANRDIISLVEDHDLTSQSEEKGVESLDKVEELSPIKPISLVEDPEEKVGPEEELEKVGAVPPEETLKDQADIQKAIYELDRAKTDILASKTNEYVVNEATQYQKTM